MPRFIFFTFPRWQGSGGVPGSGRGLALAHPAGRPVQALPRVARPQDLARKFSVVLLPYFFSVQIISTGCLNSSSQLGMTAWSREMPKSMQFSLIS